MAEAPEKTAAGPEGERAEYMRTLVFAGLLGAPVAFAAVLFQTAIHDLLHFVWEVVPDWFGWSEPAWWYVALVPGIAGLLVAGALRLPGHGGHSPLDGIAIGNVRVLDLASILPAALATLGLGLVLGPEAPLIAIGLALGALAAWLVRMDGRPAQLLALLPGLDVTPAVAMGIAAGTAAVLRAPFSAALLASLLVGSSAAEVAPLSVLASAVAVLAVVVLPDPKPATAH